MPSLSNSRILIVATDGFEEWELFGPRQILLERGAEVVLASLDLNPIQATVHDDPGKTIKPDMTIDDVNSDDFDALILPGGVRNPDQLRLHPRAIQIIRDFNEQGKPIGAICHAPWLLVEADLLGPALCRIVVGHGSSVRDVTHKSTRLRRCEVEEPLLLSASTV